MNIWKERPEKKLLYQREDCSAGVTDWELLQSESSTCSLFCCWNQWTYMILWIFALLWLLILSIDTGVATTETSATDSKIIMKDTTEQNKSDSLDDHMKIYQVFFCSVVPFIIVAIVSVVAITVSIDKNSNHSKTTRQVLGRPVCDRGAIPRKWKTTQTTLPHFNFGVTAELNNVRSRLIMLINEEINEANCMISNSAKLDRRTKQHTQFGVSENHGSRDMVRTKSWRKKRGRKKWTRANPYSVPYGDR